MRYSRQKPPQRSGWHGQRTYPKHKIQRCNSKPAWSFPPLSPGCTVRADGDDRFLLCIHAALLPSHRLHSGNGRRSVGRSDSRGLCYRHRPAARVCHPRYQDGCRRYLQGLEFDSRNLQRQDQREWNERSGTRRHRAGSGSDFRTWPSGPDSWRSLPSCYRHQSNSAHRYGDF